jgi:hypothetical protein
MGSESYHHPPVQGRDPVRDRGSKLESSNGAPQPTHRSVSASVAESATTNFERPAPHPRTGLSRPMSSGPFPFVLSLFLLGMLAREEDALMIPIIGTCLWVVKVGVVPCMVFGDSAATRFISVASLVGESAIPTFVSV